VNSPAQRRRIRSLEDAKAGLYEWAQLPTAEGGLGLTAEQVATHRWTFPEISAASRAHKTWSVSKWQRATGNRGIAGIHEFLGLRALDTIDAARDGLYEWAQLPTTEGGLGLTAEQVATHRWTLAELDAASRARSTWSARTWLKKTGNRGIAGARETIARLGAEPITSGAALDPATAEQLTPAGARLMSIMQEAQQFRLARTAIPALDPTLARV